MKSTTTRTATAPAQKRCVIYTRKSTEEGLEQQFNSLDAQRAACEAYISSQQHEGWECLPDRYDDGGFSGGNMSRPGFQRLMADARAKQFDCIVLYKIDRFSRSLRDFANAIEELDQLGVSICSVTQAFNTNTSTGRLTLNLLLTFAQFEREMVSERTSDKIRATRRRGQWTGGLPMLGYDVDDAAKRLIVNPNEAKRVRAIFDLYLEHGSLLPVVRELGRRGWTGKRWTTKKGTVCGGQKFTRTSLHRFLNNVLYIGQVRYKTEVHSGQHERIIDDSVWEQVQDRLRFNGNPATTRARNATHAILKGLLFCTPCGCAMIPSHTKRGPRKYRYYTCGRAQRSGWDTCTSKSISAGAIEQFAIDRIRGLGQDDTLLQETLDDAQRLDQAQRSRLENERRALTRDLEGWRKSVRHLVSGKTNGQLASSLGDLQSRIADAERRLEDLRRDLHFLERNPLDEESVTLALGQFDPIWNALNAVERAELLDLLIHRIEYDGANNKVAITFQPTGIRALSDPSQYGASE